MKKYIPPILLGILAACILFSCGDSVKNETKSDNTDNIPSENQQGEKEGADSRLEPGLPDVDFNGYTFTFFAHCIDYPGDWVGDGDPRELVVEEENSEPINDAVYKRNMKIMEKYNIDIQMVTNSNDLGTLKKAVSAGDDLYDAAVIFNNLVPGVVTADLLVNIEELPYVDLKKPWWDPAVNAMSIDRKNYLMAGDLLILDNEATNALLFNKDMMADFGIELPYNTVKEGKWTMDKMNEVVKNTAADLNGDGKMGDDDQWGLCVYNDSLHALFVSGGGTLAAKDENDLPYMDFTSPKNLATLERVMDLMYNPDYVINISGKDHTVGLSMFEENRVLFYWMRMRVVEFFRGMESNFGIIPLPKYDEAQNDYYSVVNPYTGVLLGVPKSAEDLERTSIILEALSAESRYTLQPAYYDVVLQRKYTRDDESSEMLDIIFNSRVYDIGGVYSFGNVWIEFINLAGKYDRNIVSFYDKKIGSIEGAIEKTVAAFQAMG
jgi:hypothetical protein